MDGHHLVVVLHGQLGNFIHKALRHVAVDHGEVPHGDHAGRLIQGLVGARWNGEFRDREIRSHLLGLFIRHADDGHIGLHFQLADGRDRNTGGKGHHVNQTILQLPAQVRPATVTALEIDAQGFHDAGEIGVGCGAGRPESDGGAIGNIRDRRNAGTGKCGDGKRRFIHGKHRAHIVHFHARRQWAVTVDGLLRRPHGGQPELQIASMNQRHILHRTTGNFSTTGYAQVLGDKVCPSGPIRKVGSPLTCGTDREVIRPIRPVLSDGGTSGGKR